VGGGFSNPIIGGGGDLVYPAIMSPNFSLAGQTGWAILKNGNAYFFNITAEGTITATSFDGTDFIINSNGAFFYSAGFAQLLNSITTQNQADPVNGAAVLAGFTSYILLAAVYYAIQYGAESIDVLTASSAAGPYTSVGGLSFTLAPGWILVFGSGLLGVVNAIQPGTSATPETWHYVNPTGGAAPAFATDWANAGGSDAKVAFKLLADSNRVQITGLALVSAGATGLMFNLPTGYVPAHNQYIPAINITTSVAGVWQIGASGNVTFTGTLTAGDKYSINGDYSLDI
jgi:hypothetical protein